MCLRLKTFWISLKNSWTADDSPETTRLSTYAITMSLTLPDWSLPVNALGSHRIRESELESNEFAMIWVNLGDHRVDALDGRLLVLGIESLLGPERTWVLLTHPLLCWGKLKLHLKLLAPVCEADSSPKWWFESLCLAYEHTSLTCQWLEWSPFQRSVLSIHLNEVRRPI